MATFKTTGKEPINTTHETVIRKVVVFALSAINIAITNSIAAFALLINALHDNILAIDALRNSISMPITGSASRKKDVKFALAAMTSAVMKRVYSYAVTNGKTELANAMRTSTSKMTQMKYINMLAYVRGAVAAITPELNSLFDYNVTLSVLNDITMLSDSLEALVVAPQVAIAERELVNKNIQRLLRSCMDTLINQCDQMAETFRTTNINYYNGYIACRRLDPHHMSTQLRMHVSDQAHMPVTEGEALIPATDCSAMLDVNGYAFINHIPFGNHKVTLTTPYGEFTYGPFDFKKGKSLTLEIVIRTDTASKATSTITKKQEVTEEVAK